MLAILAMKRRWSEACKAAGMTEHVTPNLVCSSAVHVCHEKVQTQGICRAERGGGGTRRLASPARLRASTARAGRLTPPPLPLPPPTRPATISVRGVAVHGDLGMCLRCYGRTAARGCWRRPVQICTTSRRPPGPSFHPPQPSHGPQPRFSLEIEMRTVNISEDELGINPARLVERVDANTIGVVAILGTTYTGKGRVKGRGSKGRAGGPGVCTCTPAPPRNRQTTFFHKCIRCVRGCGWTGCRARGVPRPHRPRCWHPRRRCIGRVCRPLPLARHEGGFPPPARCVDESEWP